MWSMSRDVGLPSPVSRPSAGGGGGLAERPLLCLIIGYLSPVGSCMILVGPPLCHLDAATLGIIQ